MKLKLNYDKQTMKLQVSNAYEKYNPKFIWGNFLLQHIVHSGLFEVEYQQFPRFKNDVNAIPRCGELKTFILNGNMCAIDAWDFSHPACHLTKEFLSNNSFYKDLKYIFKTQYSELHAAQYKRLKEECGITVFPFFIFPRHHFEHCQFKWQNQDHKHLAFFSGRIWKNRKAWHRHMLDQPESFFSINHASSNYEIVHKSSNSVSEDNYISLMKNSKWGLILKGKGECGKNRREVEYSSCGIPLALNYKPKYPFEFEPNKHYLYLEKPSDLEKLKTVDPKPYAESSMNLFKEYFNPEKVAYNLLKFYGHLFTK